MASIRDESKRSARYQNKPGVKKRQSEYSKKRRSAPGMREKLTRQHQEWVERRPERILWRCARDRAAEKGLSFTIRPEDIRIPDRCPLLAVPLVHNRGRKGPGANSPTIDRIDPSKGYDPGNIWVVSYRANAIKNDATPDELELIAGRVRARLAEE